MDRNEKLKVIKKAVKSYDDFPKQGIVYKDIFGIFNDVEATKLMKELLIDHVKSLNPFDAVVGLDSRGFLLGPLISDQFQVPFIPIRKKGKLPGNVIQQSYILEYGEATLEVQTESISNGMKILVVDDLLATGGSLEAAVKLLKSLDAEIVECLVIMELTSLNGRSKLNPIPVYSFLQYS